MAGRICTSLEAMCISHEASPRHAPSRKCWDKPPLTYSRYRRSRANSARSASGKPTSLFGVFGATTDSPSLSSCMHMRLVCHSGRPPNYLHITGDALCYR